MSSDRNLVWPSKVSVLGKTYTVQVMDKVDSEDSRGECQIKNKVIKIKKDTNQAKWSALLHEVTHAWLEESKFTAYLTDEDMEELLVMMIEEQFLPLVFELIGKRNILPK